jgi:hypothetical protein
LDYLFGGREATGTRICFGVDHLGPWWTGYSMENPTFIGVNLSDIKVIMTIMCVFVVELLCEAVTG